MIPRVQPEISCRVKVMKARMKVRVSLTALRTSMDQDTEKLPVASAVLGGFVSLLNFAVKRRRCLSSGQLVSVSQPHKVSSVSDQILNREQTQHTKAPPSINRTAPCCQVEYLAPPGDFSSSGCGSQRICWTRPENQHFIQKSHFLLFILSTLALVLNISMLNTTPC